MRPPRLLPTEAPFLTLLTCAYRRPQALARNLASVARQTAVAHIEQIVLPDHVGYGWDAMYGRAAWYAQAVHGRYVTWLNDDDALVQEDVVAKLMTLTQGEPEVVIVKVRKGGVVFPKQCPVPPIEGNVDLGCYVLRRDVWQRHVSDYGHRYQGDYDHALVLEGRNYRTLILDVLFAEGPASGGVTEVSVDWK